MAESFLKITNKFDFRKLRNFNRKVFPAALKKGAVNMLEWSANGSSKVPEKPPIRWGVLKGSGSVFVDGKLVETTAESNPPKAGTPTPVKTFPGKKNTLKIVYNTDSAAAMHEGEATFKDARGKIVFQPGDFSKQAGNSNPGNQWLRKHLSGDGGLLMDTIGRMMKSGLNK